VILSAILAPAAFAADRDTRAQPLSPQQADDGSLEFGVWWVQWYNPPSAGCAALNNLPATRPDALGLRDKLVDPFWFLFLPYPTPRWTPRFVYGDGNAWESDWKRSDAPYFGGNNNYADAVDLAYFAGHGSSTAFYFGQGGCLHHDQRLTYTDAELTWGNVDMDWAGIAACNVLDDPHLADWANTMDGLRLFMGMKTVMDDVPHGRNFGNYVRWNHNMTQAWFRAMDDLQSQGRVTRVVAEHPAYYNDHWNNHNDFTVVDNTFHWWTHPVGSEPARTVDLSQLNQEMPRFRVQTLSAAAATQRFNALGSAFGVDTSAPISYVLAAAPTALNAGNTISGTNDYQLLMDSSAGLYNYTELDSLWSSESAEIYAASGTAMQSISSDEARSIATTFLSQNSLLAVDAQFFEVVQDVQTDAQGKATEGGEGLAMAASPTKILAENPTNHQVIFSRIISYTPPSAAGGQADPIEFSVMGPGSKLKVYVATQVPATVTAASLLEDAIIGGVGGYREVNLVLAAGANQPLTTPVLPTSTIQTLFDKVESTVALSYVPLTYESRQVVSMTPAYWEGPQGFSQDELIPVYELTVRNTLSDTSIVTSTTYIPVNASFMAPYAKIASVTADEPVLPGEEITLNAADASQTLKALGIDDSLDFVLGTGSEDSYLYEWYLNEVSDETKIGTGRTLKYTVPAAADPNKPTELKIILRVVDSEKTSEPNSSTDEYFLAPSSNVFLPLVETD
jgi:hypothetical protein